ncbi:hypothetical protein OE88DRAFT_269911 [Heliocybe sulcata]|uniref:Uncharacterized protein n=1 Tax=Heliocybe sulcata TaxID=5364 RepID=A0A5C3N398_9AGAM|nr:hypothetical protein OE88DRAFT_269911 [Heliocybe sulcata]
MSPAETGYDERLLASAPAATRAEKQEGYNIDLLDEEPSRAGRASTTHDHTGGYVQGNRYSGAASAPDTPSLEEKPGPLSRGRTPWWRTATGIAVLVILSLIIVGAVVGGAVGGSLGSRKSQNDLAEGSSSSSASTQSKSVPNASSTVQPSGIGLDTSGLLSQRLTATDGYNTTSDAPTSSAPNQSLGNGQSTTLSDSSTYSYGQSGTSTAGDGPDTGSSSSYSTYSSYPTGTSSSWPAATGTSGLPRQIVSVSSSSPAVVTGA